MSHNTKTVETKVISDEQISVRVRCCEDPLSDSWHSLQITPATTPEEVKAWHEERHKDVQTKHAARHNAHSLLDSLK